MGRHCEKQRISEIIFILPSFVFGSLPAEQHCTEAHKSISSMAVASTDLQEDKRNSFYIYLIRIHVLQTQSKESF